MFQRAKRLFKNLKALTTRDFTAASSSRFIDWNPGFVRSSGELKRGYLPMTLRARDLAKNNDYVVGYLKNMVRNVIGPDGFSLHSKADDPKIQQEIEKLWKEYQSASGKWVTLDCRCSGRDLDILILRTLIIDGEVFIRRVWDPSSRFGYRYEVMDSIDIDPLYNVDNDGYGGSIVMGVHLDQFNREIGFFIRDHNSDLYLSGERYEIAAEEVLHLYRKNFPDQVRGYTELAPVIMNLWQMNDYKESEIIHARGQACTMGIWEQIPGADTSDELTTESDSRGIFHTEIAPGSFKMAPRGYKASFLQSSSPNGQFGAFWKVILRGVSNALGLSYNKASGDYESVNYSSLREATLEDRASFEDVQYYLTDNWKSVQFSSFISGLVLKGNFQFHHDALRHKFFGKLFPWVDPVKEISALEKEFDLLLTDPYTELERRGIDVDETIRRWKNWNEKLKENGLSFMATKPMEIMPEIEEENNNAEN